MNKKTSLYLLLLPMCTSLVSCNGGGGGEIAKTRVWWAYSTENLISDWNYFDETDEDNSIYQDRDNTLRFNCMKNENEGIQLMISPEKYISKFDFVLPDVTGPNGTIGKENFTVAAAYYLNVDYSNERSSISGLYPDALIPLANYKLRRMNYIEGGFNQALYINLKTKENTPAGEYKGTGQLILDDKTIDIPFEVNVYDAVMSSANHIKSSYLIWYDQIVNGEKRNADAAMNLKYYEFAVSKRLSPGDLPPELKGNDIDIFINNYIEKVVKDERVSGGRLLSNGDYSKERLEALLTKMIDKNIELRNQGDNKIDLFKKGYFYIDDEPTPTSYEKVKRHDKEIFDTKRELSKRLVDYPDLYESFTHMENIVTTPFNETLIGRYDEETGVNEGGVECWCPQAQNFQTKEARDTYRSRQNSTDRPFGEHVWWYVCNDPIMPYPNYHLDAKLILPRVMRYMQYNYNIDGNLFWNICFYSKQKANFTGPRDIWTDPISWESCAGDGMLVYPGLTFGIDGPITTLRMESIMAGNEEYEYLWMINEKVKEYNSLNSTNYVTNNLLQKYYSRLYTDMISNLDVDEFDSVRIELLKLVETIYKDLDDGMDILIG